MPPVKYAHKLKYGWSNADDSSAAVLATLHHIYCVLLLTWNLKEQVFVSCYQFFLLTKTWEEVLGIKTCLNHPVFCVVIVCVNSTPL